MRTVRAAVTVAVLGFAMLAGTPKAQAGQALITKISEITMTGNGHVLVKFATAIANRGSCTTIPNSMAFDATTGKGKALLSMANAAFLGSILVVAMGTQTGTTAGCTLVTLSGGGTANYETLYYLSMAQ